MPYADNEKLKAYQRTYYQNNREKRLAQVRAWERNNPGRTKERKRLWREKNVDRFLSRAYGRLANKLKLGFTQEEYNRKLIAQGGLCAICGQPETTTRCRKDGSRIDLAIDHCHVSGQVRDLLCQACNLVLGIFKEDTSRFRAAALYLERHNG